MAVIIGNTRVYKIILSFKCSGMKVNTVTITEEITIQIIAMQLNTIYTLYKNGTWFDLQKNVHCEYIPDNKLMENI